MRRIDLVLATLTTAAAVVVPTAAWGAPPPAVRCGATLSRPAQLTRDLVCPRDGVTLTGRAVLDLGGHTLTARAGTAVLIATGSNPTVRNGSVADSTTGIASADDRDSPPQYRRVTITRVTLKRNATGLLMGNTDATVVDSHFQRNGVGAYGSFGGTTAVSGSSFTDNSTAVRYDTAGIRVTRSYLGNNGTGLQCEEANPCALTDSRVQDTADAAVSVVKAPLLIRRVTVARSGVGIAGTDGFGLDVADSTFVGNTIGADLSLVQAVFDRNVFADNIRGVSLSSQLDERTATFTRNTFRRNNDGFIAADDSVARLGRNLAVDNRGWGLYAPSGVDLGGNRAYGNDSDPQCLGVVCTS